MNGDIQGSTSVADQIRPKVPKVAILDDAEPDVLAYMTFPKEHRAKRSPATECGNMQSRTVFQAINALIAFACYSAPTTAMALISNKNSGRANPATTRSVLVGGTGPSRYWTRASFTGPR